MRPQNQFSILWFLLGGCLAAVWARGALPTKAAAGVGLDASQKAFFSPEQVQMRGELAAQAASAAGLSPALTSSVQAAAKESQVNDVDASQSINTTIASLLPWSDDPESILLPKAGGTVQQWRPLSDPSGPLELSPADAEAAQAVPVSSDESACCAKLSALGFHSNLPVVVIDTGGAVARLRRDVPATLCTCGASNGTDYEGPIEFRVRGSSSAVQMVKKSFGVKFRSADGNLTAAGKPKKQDVSFLGLTPASDWALYGDDLDLTLGMRNALGYATAQEMGRWAPGTRFFELLLMQDGQPLSAANYWGVYLAVEKVEIHPGRLPLYKLNPDKDADLSGGYVLGFERSLWPTDVRVSPSKWSSVGANASCPSGDGRNLTYILQDPSAEGANLEQQGLGPPSNDSRMVAWAASYLGSVESALVLDQLPATTPAIPAGSAGWRALVDEVAFIDYLLSQEVSKNPDANRGSVYMYKDKDQPLIMGPVWDLNEAFGSCCGYPIEGYQQGGRSTGSSGGSAISPGGWRFNICDEPERCVADPQDGISLWWRAVWNREPAFRKAVAKRWQLLRAGPLSDTFFQTQFLSYEQQLALAAPRNFKRWHKVVSSAGVDSDWETYARRVRGMFDWTRQRVAWLDSELKQVEAAAESSGAERGSLSGAQTQAVIAAVTQCAQAAAEAARIKVVSRKRPGAAGAHSLEQTLQQMLSRP